MASNIIDNTSNSEIAITLDIYSFKDGDVYFVYSPALDLTGYGYSSEEAKSSFDIVLKNYLQHALSHGTLSKDLKAHGWSVRSLRKNRLKSPPLDYMLLKNPVLKDIMLNRDYSKSKTEFAVMQ